MEGRDSSVWKSHYNGLYKTNSLNSITSNATEQPLIKIQSKSGLSLWRWTIGKGNTTNWKMSIHGNKIEAGIVYQGVGINQYEDSEFTRGAYGFFTVSQPTNFLSIKINTIRALKLQEIISKITWKSDETNVIVNFNNQKEEELSQQACINAFNSKGIHYEQVTTSANASDVNTFLGKIGNRGKYVESSNYNTYMNQLTDYIATYVKNK